MTSHPSNVATDEAPSEALNDFASAFSEVDSDPGEVESALQEIIPPPASSDFDQLEEESQRHRVLLMRTGAVIAVTTLLSIGGAIFFHTLIAGLILVGWYAGVPAKNAPSRGVGGGDSPVEGGNGYVINDDSGNPTPPSSPSSPLAAAGPSVSAPPLPSLPNLPDIAPANIVSLPQPALPIAPVTPDIAPPISPLPTLGSVRVLPPTPQILPLPNPANNVSAAITGAGGTGNTPGAPAIANGGDSGDPQNFGPPHEWIKGNGSGLGDGQGNGIGNGIDRGPSAANIGAQIINAPAFSLPSRYMFNPPKREVSVDIRLNADGSIAAVTLKQSCGISDLDNEYVRFVRDNFRFHPAIKNGKPIPWEGTFSNGWNL